MGRRHRTRQGDRAPFGPDCVIVGHPHVVNRGRLVVGARAHVESVPIRTHLVVGPGATLRIGDRVRIGAGCGVSCEGSIDIGDDVVLGPYVQLLDSDHHVAGDTTGRRPEPQPIRIGAGAVLGAWTTVLPGADIGAGAVVAAGSVVAGAIAPGASVAGNPAIDRRFDGHAIGDLGDLGGVDEAVCDLVTELFALVPRATRSTRRDEVDRWTSLGSLRLLVGLEALVGGAVSESAVAAATSVSDLIDIAGAAREASAAVAGRGVG